MRMYPNEHLLLWGHPEECVEGAWSDPREEEPRLFIQFPKRQWLMAILGALTSQHFQPASNARC